MPLHLIDHPLIRHKIGLMRRYDLSVKDFRQLTGEVCRLLTYEAAKSLPTEKVSTQGWAGPVEVERIKGKKLTAVPILRAGLGMLDGFLDIIPVAKVSVAGLFRNEATLEPVEYYVNLTGDMPSRQAVILDPMLATGGSLLATIDLLKKAGCPKISGIFLVAAPEGVEKVLAAHPEVDLFVAALDQKLNDHGYILPGLGDAGDKIFGTKNK